MELQIKERMKTNQENNLMDTKRVVDESALDSLFNSDVDMAVSTPILSSSHPIHYDYQRELSELIVLTGDTEYNEATFYASSPLFFESTNSRYIPNKVKRTIERYCSKKKLREIHPDEDVAVELCLIILSSLANAYHQDKSGWKRLHSTILREQVSNHQDSTYKKIIELLIEGTNNGPIIERSKNYTPGQESYRYRLGPAYKDKGFHKYDFLTEHAKNLVRKTYFKLLSVATNNVIANNLIKTYSKISLPSVDEIKIEAKRLIKQGYTNKKGKILTKRNKHKNDYWKDADNRSFVEDNIELFLRLTENGYLIPTISEEKAGGRVTDSFVLMPSWIRNLCKIDGQKIVEADYSALHPNIAIKLYGGCQEYVTHQRIADDLEVDLLSVKIEHLSFFNHRWNNLYKSPLYKWYEKHDYNILGNLHKDKAVNHKITTYKMFKVEVDIMTAVIKKLNSEGIYVGYIYDALFCAPQEKERVTVVMNEEILKFGVKTTAK
jgi:hypothetical protein